MKRDGGGHRVARTFRIFNAVGEKKHARRKHVYIPAGRPVGLSAQGLRSGICGVGAERNARRQKSALQLRERDAEALRSANGAETAVRRGRKRFTRPCLIGKAASKPSEAIQTLTAKTMSHSGRRPAATAFRLGGAVLALGLAVAGGWILHDTLSSGESISTGEFLLGALCCSLALGLFIVVAQSKPKL